MEYEDRNAVWCDQQETLQVASSVPPITNPLKLMNVNKNTSLLQSVQDLMLTPNHVEPQDSSGVIVFLTFVCTRSEKPGDTPFRQMSQNHIFSHVYAC